MDNPLDQEETSNRVADDPSITDVRLAIMDLLDEGLIEVSGYTVAGDPIYVAVNR